MLYADRTKPVRPPRLGVAGWRRWAALLVLAGALSRAGLSPHETVLVVNADSWMSRSVAARYALARNIPHHNVVMLDGLGIRDGVTVDEFREQILKPVLATCNSRGLSQRMSCIIYSVDFPTWIDFKKDIGNRKMPRIIGSQAALTGLTYLYQDVLAGNLDYADLDANWYARRHRHRHPGAMTFSAEDREAYREVEAFFQEKRRRRNDDDRDPREVQGWLREHWRQTLQTLVTLTGKYPHHPQLVYNLACAQAQTGRLLEAIHSLEKAINLGFNDLLHIRNDDDFEPLRHRQDFEELLAQAAERRPEMTPPIPFSGRGGWTPLGMPVASYKGARYLVSAMLGVTYGRGNSFEEVIECLERAVRADASAPEGTIYFMDNNDVRSRTRAWAVRSAMDEIEDSGVKAERISGVIPADRTDVAGLFTGAASFNWERSGNQILAGAICEHLTSFGAVFRENAGQTPLSEFIRHGAAGASGTVCEPFAIQAKFPTALIQAYYTAGYTLGEAFYLSVTAPYQLLIVGDPLCAPWARPPAVSIEGVKAGQSVQGDTVSLTVGLAAGANPRELVEATWSIDGRIVAARPPRDAFEVPVAKLPPGWHEVTLDVIRADRTGTRGHARASFFTGGSRDAFDLAALNDQIPVRWGEPVRLKRVTNEQNRLIVTWMGGDVASMAGGQNTIDIPSPMLAMGDVRLHPILLTGDRSGVLGLPIDVTIAPPEPTAAAPAGLASVLGKGLQLTVAGTTTVHPGKAAGDWLKKAGVTQGEAVTINAWFETDRQGVGHFQFRGNLPLDKAVSVDGRTLVVPAGEHWRSAPVSLAKGAHNLIIRTIGVDDPILDIRFGIAGTKTVSGEDFRHR